jgi:TolB-like protein
MSEEAPESREGQKPSSPAVHPALGGTTGGASHAAGHVHAHHSAIPFRFLEQLKHRNVIRVGILYLVACWLILDPVHVVFHMLDVPVWANRMVVILMAIGFPVALLFAWVYEVTPEGLKPTADVDPHQSIRKLTAQRLDRAILVVLLLAIAYLLLDRVWIAKHLAGERPIAVSAPVAPANTPVMPAISDKSVAVLPFADMSEKNDQEYFADGVAEEVLNRLARVPGLRVVGRASSFQFKGKNADSASTGSALGVAYLLEGSVRREPGRVRVTAQLLEARTGSQRWSDRFDSQVIDVLHVQDTIAAEIARALQIVVDVDVAPRASVKSPEALDAYLRELQAFERHTRAGCEAAVADFQQALALDPMFFTASDWPRQDSCLYGGPGLVAAADCIRARPRGCVTRAPVGPAEPGAPRSDGSDPSDL